MSNSFQGSKLISFLKRVLRVDVGYMLEGGSWLLLSQTLNGILLFIVSIALAHLLSQQDYGTYKYILSLAGMLGAFTLTGMNAAVVSAVSRGSSGTWSASVRVQLRWSTIMAAGGLILAGYYLVQGNMQLGIAVLVAALTLPFTNSLNTFSAYLNGTHRFRQLALSSFWIAAGTNIAVLVGAVLWGDPSVLSIVYFLVSAAITIYYYFRTPHVFAPQTVDDEAIEYGKKLSATYLLSSLSMHFDKVIIFQFLGPVQVAFYHFALLLPDQIRGLFKIGSTLALPRFSQQPLGTLRGALWRKMALVLGSATLAGGIYIVVAPSLYQLLLPQYLDAARYSRIIALSLIPGAAAVLLSAVLQSQKETQGKFSRFNITSSVLRIILVLFFTWQYGLAGAAWSFLAANIASVALLLHALHTSRTRS